MLLSFAAGVQAESTLTTTHLPDSSLTFSVDGSSLTVSGAILCDRLEKIMVSAGEEERFLTAGSGKQIRETFTLIRFPYGSTPKKPVRNCNGVTSGRRFPSHTQMPDTGW